MFRVRKYHRAIMIEAFSMYALIAVDCKLQDFIMFEQVRKKMPLQLVIHKIVI